MKASHLFIGFLLAISIQFGYSQSGTIPEEEPNIVPSDSLSAPTERSPLESFKLIFSGKPGKAALYSLIVPGGGQLYNRKYWKAPIVWAVEGVAVYIFIDIRNDYINFKNTHANVINGIEDSYRGISGEASLRRYRNQYRLDMERAGIAVVIIHLASVIEAFTDRHLMQFDISEDLSFHLKVDTTPMQSYSGIGLSYTLK